MKKTILKTVPSKPAVKAIVCLLSFFKKTKSSSLGFLINKAARLKPRVARDSHLGRFRGISLAQGTRTSSIAFDSRHITWNDFTSCSRTRGFHVNSEVV